MLTGAEAARIKAMNEPGGASTAIAALTAKPSWPAYGRSEQTNKTGDLANTAMRELAAIIRGGQPRKTPLS